MGFFDRFKSEKEHIGKDKKPKHIVAKTAKEKAELEKKRQFAAVPAGGKAEKPKTDAHEKKSEPKQAPRRKDDTRSAYRVLIRALISEKSSMIGASNQYVFVIDRRANKIEVGKAISALYGVKPQKINVLNYSGKSLRYGKTQGMTKAWKKAIVTLKSGQTIDVGGA